MATLKRGNSIFVTTNDNVISAFLNNGYEVVEGDPQPQPVKEATKKTKKTTTK